MRARSPSYTQITPPLIVRVSGEDFGFFGGNGGVTLVEGDDNTSSRLDTEGKRRNVEKEKVVSLIGGVAEEDGSLDGRTMGNSFIRADALVGLLAIEEVGNKFDDMGNMSEATDQDDFMDLGVAEHFSTGSRALRKGSW